MYLLPDFTLEMIYQFMPFSSKQSKRCATAPDKIQFCTGSLSQKTQWKNVQWDWFLFQPKNLQVFFISITSTETASCAFRHN